MAKKKKHEESFARLVPAEDAVRKALATALIQQGALLDISARNLEAMQNLNGVRALSGKEMQYVELAAKKLREAQKICLVIGRRNQRAS